MTAESSRMAPAGTEGADQPLISVAIPAYNHEKFIQDCLQSVVDQSYRNLELVVVDDGSTDNTAKAVETFLKQHRERFQRIEFRSRPNCGVSATSNEAIELCRGEWVHLLGSDDRMGPDKVASQWQAVQEWDMPDLALIYADAGYIDADGQLLKKTTGTRPAAGPTRDGYLELFFANRIPNPTVALRREAFLAVGGFDENLFLEDWDCWLRLAAAYPIGRVPRVLSYYRYHEGNTHLRQAEMLEAMLISFGKFLSAEGERLPQALVKKNWRKNLHRLWRWARKNDSGCLAKLAASALVSLVVTPNADDYFRYAGLIRRSLESRAK